MSQVLQGHYRYFLHNLQFDSTSNQTALCFFHSCFSTDHNSFFQSHGPTKQDLSFMHGCSTSSKGPGVGRHCMCWCFCRVGP